MKTKEQVIEKVKALLALGDSKRNDSEAEVQAAMLKAQQLMVKYDISTEEVNEQESQEYAHEVCEHKWDYAYRTPLANVLAKNFRCMVYKHGKNITFMGHSSDAKICRATFEYAYQFIQREGNRVYNRRYQMGLPTKGAFNSYASGFIQGLKEAFDVQCTALAIITPQDVIDEFEELSKNWKRSKARRVEATDSDAWNAGREDGKKFMDKDKLSE